MLVPSPRKKSDHLQASLPLETPEQIRLSVERDQALSVRAQLERDQIAVERDRFELGRDKIVFGFQLALAVIALVAVLITLILDPELIPVTALSGTGMNKIVKVFQRS